VTAPRIASFPMYDYPELAEAHDALWQAVAARLRAAGVRDVPMRLDRRQGHRATWRNADLLLGQGCEYPLAKDAAQIRVVATPRYTAPGCVGATYCSAVIVRAADCAATLADLRGRRCVINEVDSNSGMNLLRAAIAPLAGGDRFFASVAISGAHRESLAFVASGEADVAAIDCVSFAHFQHLETHATRAVRVLCWTARCPSLPYITARTVSAAKTRVLHDALASAVADPELASVRERLLLGGIESPPAQSFTTVLELERRASELGYPVLI
jgi:ABC-type phosphate/phosphonate transport system substrate-binding protein